MVGFYRSSYLHVKCCVKSCNSVMTLERNMALSRYALTGFAERIGLAEKEEQKDSDCQCAQERAKKERE